jgi:hypothetical protein
MPCITALTRMPALKCASCVVIQSDGMPASDGFAEVGLAPSAPWQAAQTCVTICWAFARSGFVAGAWAKARAGRPAAMAQSSVRFMDRLSRVSMPAT